ncbi:hypothetical protein JOM56_009264, partial [Amanita muscaria]
HEVANFSTNTGTFNLRKHLYTDHLAQWVTSCDNLKIEITAKAALPFVRKFRQEPVDTPLESERPEYSKKGFIEAILEFIVGDDQAISVVESPRLRKIFLLLRKELKESDIPGRSTMRNCIEQTFKEH